MANKKLTQDNAEIELLISKLNRDRWIDVEHRALEINDNHFRLRVLICNIFIAASFVAPSLFSKFMCFVIAAVWFFIAIGGKE